MLVGICLNKNCLVIKLFKALNLQIYIMTFQKMQHSVAYLICNCREHLVGRVYSVHRLVGADIVYLINYIYIMFTLCQISV
jgi:hypothetical protein